MEAVAVISQKTEPNVEPMTWGQEFERVAEKIREAARMAGVEDMSMEEIDAEIAAYRQEKRELENK